MNFSRLYQVIQYALIHSRQVSGQQEVKANQLAIFVDMLGCYFRYGMWTNQYIKEKMYALSNLRREEIGSKYHASMMAHENWVKDFYVTRRFLSKWTGFDIESSASKRRKRQNAYQEYYRTGNDLMVEYGVVMNRQHYLPGTLSIGNHVLLAKNVFIDYSGEVIIEDGVKIAAGVSIESHHRDLDAYKQGKDVNIPTKLVIRENAYIGTHAIILDSCNYIGRNARIGAGAVVVTDIPDNAVAVGVPAKVVRLLDDTSNVK